MITKAQLESERRVFLRRIEILEAEVTRYKKRELAIIKALTEIKLKIMT